MEGYYQTNQLPLPELENQVSHQPEEQQQTHPQPNVLAMSISDTAIPSQLRQQPQQPQPALHNHMIPNQTAVTGSHLDDAMRHNDIRRRRSMPPNAHRNAMTSAPQVHPPRRMSTIGPGDVMGFDTGTADFSGYHFDPEIPPPFPDVNASISMQDQIGSYVTDAGVFPAISQDIMGSMMPSQFASMDMGGITADPQTIDLFPSASGQVPDLAASSIAGHLNTGQFAPTDDGFAMTGDPNSGSLGVRPNNGPEGMAVVHDEDMINVPHQQFTSMNAGPSHISMEPGMRGYRASMSSSLPGSLPVIPTQQNTLSMDKAQPSSTGTATPVPISTSRDQSKERTIYSKSGFDMLKALWLVATRKSPKIHLGAVDMSCAFVVCDVTMNDCPIIYVSDNFQNLTGYSRHEIIGQNCRFLQAPDGKVEAGSKREFVDDGAVFNLKRMIKEGREVQQSLINYRKGGKPFLNLLTMIPIPWDTDEIRYFIGFQIDLVECPDAISGQEMGGVKVNYKHNDIGQYIWTPPTSNQGEPENGQTLGVDDVSTLLQQFNPNGLVSDWHKQSWDKMLLENTDDVVHVISIKGLFLYLSPSCKRVLEYDAADLVGNSLSSVCHPSDIVPVTRELKDATAGSHVNIVFRIRRKQSGYTWFESHGSLFVDQGRGRKCIILVGRKRPVFALSRRTLEANGGIGDSELWSKLSTSGMFLSASTNIRSLLDLQPESLVGTSIQELMRKESRAEFGRTIEKARRGKISTCKHEMLNRRGQGLQAQTTLYPGDALEGQKPSFVLAQTKLLKASSRHIPSTLTAGNSLFAANSLHNQGTGQSGQFSQPAGGTLAPGSQDAALASDDNIFDELRTTKCSSWQFELRQMEKINRILAEELGGLLSNKKKRKRRKGVGNVVRDCANCHTRNTPEWRRGPSGQRDLCNSCGLRWAKQTGRVSPRNSTRGGPSGNTDAQSKISVSPVHSSPLHRSETPNPTPGNGESNLDPVQPANKIAAAPSGTASIAGQHPSSTMPPPSQSSLTTGTVNSGMASIREERESSQT